MQTTHCASDLGYADARLGAASLVKDENVVVTVCGLLQETDVMDNAVGQKAPVSNPTDWKVIQHTVT